MNEYYYKKAKDSEKQAVYWMWGAIIVLCIGTWYCTYKWLTHECPEPEPKLFVEKFMELQREAGCKLIDAKVGPEVKLLFNAKAEEELPEYYNRCAAPYFTASGAPQKEVITHRIRNPPSERSK